jgi:hypothetical protein
VGEFQATGIQKEMVNNVQEIDRLIADGEEKYGWELFVF